MSEPSALYKLFLPSLKPATLKPDRLRLGRNILNAVFFQLGWFACVLGGDTAAVAALVILLGCHRVLVGLEPGEWRLILAVGSLGIGIDSLLALAGVLVFEQAGPGLIPIWLGCIWVLFATTLRHSLAWLQNRPLWAALLGAVAGPCSYFAGAQLANVGFLQPVWVALLVMSLLWAVMLPLQFYISRRVTPCSD